MNFKKILSYVFLFIFCFTLPLTTVFSKNLVVPKAINEIFPDHIVAEKIAQILSKSSIYEAVTQDELNSIKNFKRVGVERTSNPVDISGIQYLDNLNTFSIINGGIVDLSPLSELENLMSLDLSCNLIIDLKPLSRLKKLFCLSLECNRIEDLSPLSKLQGLKVLNIQNNPIKDLSPLKSLKFIELKTAGTHITGHELSKLTSDADNKGILGGIFGWLLGY